MGGGLSPEMVGPDLLLISTEFNQWELREQRVADRLDVLFLDADGNLLVAELKRGDAPDTTELQALKYAAYCSTLTTRDLVEEYSRYHEVALDAGQEAVHGHAPILEDGEPGAVRVRLLASRFGAGVTSVVLWLGELGLDIGCVEIRARQLSDAQAVVIARQILPPPEAKDYLVRRRRREAVEEGREASRRRPQTVATINQHGSVPAGTVVELNLGAFSEEQRPAIQQQLDQFPGYGRATWTGRSSRHAIKWEHNGETYSPSGLAWKMLNDLNFSPGGINGSVYWTLPNGRTLWEEAETLIQGEGRDAMSDASSHEPAVAADGASGTVS